MVFDKHGDEIYFENDVARKTDEVRRTIQKCVKERVIRQDNAKKPETPPAPQKPEPPKTGDSSMMGLWVALLLVSGAAMTGTVLYSRKKRVNNR